MESRPSSRRVMGFVKMVRKRGGKNNAITHGAYAEDLICWVKVSANLSCCIEA